MTLADLLHALRRRWPVLLIGLLVTLPLAYLAAKPAPVYDARTQVVFMAPSSLDNPNELVTQAESVIITAGIVAKRINGATRPLLYGSPEVDAVGVPDVGDTWIQLLNTGTQWVPAFDEQVLLVDTVGATREEAAAKMDAAITRIHTVLNQLQREQHVAPINDITTISSPDPARVTRIEGSRPRAAGMTAAIGLFLTLTAVIALEVRRGARSPNGPSPEVRRSPARPVPAPVPVADEPVPEPVR
jgi:hypothetical protein